MPEITRRREGELLRKLFEILMATPDGMRAKDALASLADRVQLTPFEAGSYASGGQRFDKIVRFSTLGPVKAGWLLKTKGQWTVTDAGRRAYEQFKDPEAFFREAVRLYKEWNATRSDSDSEEPAEIPEDGEGTSGKWEAVQTFEVAEEQAWQEIERFLKQMNPYEFQGLVADLIKAMGYHVAWIAPPGKDGGIDILAFSDPLGTRSPRIKVQVKRQQQSVSVDGLRSFLALLGDDDVGIFVNTGGFTRDAQDEARTQAKRRITLIDIEKLFDLWVEHYDDLEYASRRRMPLKPIYFLAPSD
jgi:restriction system protein